MEREPSAVLVAAIVALVALGFAEVARAQPVVDAGVTPTPAADAAAAAAQDVGSGDEGADAPDAADAAPAQGSPPADAGPPAPPASPAGEDGFSPSRERPDYDTRGDDPATAGDVLLWIPRILFSPIYLLTEFVIRRPLGFLIAGAERANVPGLLIDFFTFGPEQKAGLVPTFLLDFGFLPSVGFYFFADDVGARGHSIRARGATWGSDFLTLSILDRVTIARETTLGIRAQGTRRKDWLFYGLGPDVSPSNLSRYSRDFLETGVVLDSSFWRASTLRVFAGVRRSTFDSGEACCADPSIAQRIAAGPGDWDDATEMVEPNSADADVEPLAELPPGFTSGYFVYRQSVDAAIDSRQNRPENASGFRLAASFDHAVSVEDPLRSRWLRWGGALGGFWDVSGLGHVVGLQVGAYFAEALGRDDTVPFTEQVVVGGNTLLRGFVEGYLIDRSAIAATLEYRWPIWVFLDGTLQASLGNVFGEHLDGIALDRMRGSFTLGLRTLSRPDHAVDFMIGLGTAPIDQGFEIEQFRLVIGTTAGF